MSKARYTHLRKIERIFNHTLILILRFKYYRVRRSRFPLLIYDTKRFYRVRVYHIEILCLNVLVHSWYFDIHGNNISINQIRAIHRVEIRKMYKIARLADQIYI